LAFLQLEIVRSNYSAEYTAIEEVKRRPA